LVNPPGVVTVAVGLAGTELPLVAVHTTLPPVLGLGVQVVPGTVSVLPVATLLQVITVIAVWLDGLGLAVQLGAVGAPVCVKLTGPVLVLPAGSVEVIVGLVDKLAPVPVQVTVVPLVVHVAPGKVLVLPASTVQVMVTGVLPPALVGLAVQALGAAGAVASLVTTRVPVAALPLTRVCVALMVTGPSAKALTFTPLTLQAPAVQVGDGLTVMLPITTTTARVFSEQVPLAA
jgi:hypothetical protein